MWRLASCFDKSTYSPSPEKCATSKLRNWRVGLEWILPKAKRVLPPSVAERGDYARTVDEQTNLHLSGQGRRRFGNGRFHARLVRGEAPCGAGGGDRP